MGVRGFGGRRGKEFRDGVDKLEKEGMKEVIVDLEGKGGG